MSATAKQLARNGVFCLSFTFYSNAESYLRLGTCDPSDEYRGACMIISIWQARYAFAGAVIPCAMIDAGSFFLLSSRDQHSQL